MYISSDFYAIVLRDSATFREEVPYNVNLTFYGCFLGILALLKLKL